MIVSLPDWTSSKRFKELSPEDKEFSIGQWALNANKIGREKFGDEEWRNSGWPNRIIENVSEQKEFQEKTILGSDGAISRSFDRLVSTEGFLRTGQALAEFGRQFLEDDPKLVARKQQMIDEGHIKPVKVDEGAIVHPFEESFPELKQSLEETAQGIALTLEEEGFNDKAKLDSKLPFYHPINVSRMVNSSVPFMASTIVGGVVGGPPGALATSATVIGASSFKEFKDKGIEPNEAMTRAVIGAIPQAALESIVPLKIIKGGNPFSIYKAVKLYFNEAFTEGGQKAINELAGRVGNEPINEIFADPNFYLDVFKDAAAGGILGPLFGGPVAASNYISQKISDRLGIDSNIETEGNVDPFVDTEKLTDEKANELIQQQDNQKIDKDFQKIIDQGGIVQDLTFKEKKNLEAKINGDDLLQDFNVTEILKDHSDLNKKSFNDLLEIAKKEGLVKVGSNIPTSKHGFVDAIIESRNPGFLDQIENRNDPLNKKQKDQVIGVKQNVKPRKKSKAINTAGDIQTKRNNEVKIKKTESEKEKIASPLKLEQSTTMTSKPITKTSNIPQDAQPDTPSIKQLNFVPVSTPISPVKQSRKGTKKLTFEPTKLAETALGRVVLSFRRNFTKDKTAPVEIKKIRVFAEGLRKSFVNESVNVGKELDNAINKSVKGVPERQQLRDLSNAFLNNTLSDDLILTIPSTVRDAVSKGRALIDSLSKKMVDIELIEGQGRLPKVFTENFGSYVTRTYKLHDANANWNKDTIPLKIIDAANKYFQRTRKISKSEAAEIVRDVIDPAISQDWLLGQTRLQGMNVSSLLNKNKELAPEILDLLGEVRNPMENIIKTVDRQASMIASFQMQEQIAQVGFESGLFSYERKGDLRHELFPDTDSVHTEGEGKDQKISSFRRFKNKKFKPLRNIFTTKEMADSISEFFEVQGVDKHPWISLWFRKIGKATSIGKFSQVILSPDAYPVAMAGALGVELMNGRLIMHPKISLLASHALATNYIKKKKGKFKSTPISKIEKVINLTGKDFLKQIALLKKDSALLESLARRFSVLDDQVILGEIQNGFQETIDGVLATWPADQVGIAKKAWNKSKIPFKALSKVYTYGDNAGKINAFLVESMDYARIYPDKKMEHILKVAGDITQATTPMFSQVLPALRDFNLLGMTSTYISFYSEMSRNIWNTALIAKHEIEEGRREKNGKLLRHGLKRMTAFLATMAFSVFGAGKLFDFVRDILSDSDDLDEETKKAIQKWFGAPWDKFDQLGFLRYKHGKGVMYTNTSYTIPQSAITGFVSAALRGEDYKESLLNMTSNVFDIFFGNAILSTSAWESILNHSKRTGTQVYNKELNLVDKSVEIFKYIANNAFLPGFMTKYKRMKKQANEEKGGWGRIYSLDEEAYRLFAFRPVNLEFEGHARHRMAEFKERLNEAKKVVNESSLKNLSEKDLQKRQEKEDKAISRIQKDYIDFIKAALLVGMTPRKIRNMQFDIWDNDRTRQSVPNELKQEVRDLLNLKE